jgi:chorismate mutase
LFGFSIELEAAKKQAETDKKTIDDRTRERDILQKVCSWYKRITKVLKRNINKNNTPITLHDCFIQSMLKAASATQKQIHLVRLHEQSKKNLEQDIQNYREEAQKQRKIIYQLEKERDRYINEASDLTQRVGICDYCTVLILCKYLIL